MGGALLLAKVRVGELLKEIPKAKENQHTKKMQSDSAVTLQTKEEKAEKLGFSLFLFVRFFSFKSIIFFRW